MATAFRLPSLSTAGPRSASGGNTPRGGAGALHPAFGPTPGAGSTAGSLAELLQLPAPQQSDLPATLQPPAPDRPPSMREIWAQVRPVACECRSPSDRPVVVVVTFSPRRSRGGRAGRVSDRKWLPLHGMQAPADPGLGDRAAAAEQAKAAAVKALTGPPSPASLKGNGGGGSGRYWDDALLALTRGLSSLQAPDAGSDACYCRMSGPGAQLPADRAKAGPPPPAPRSYPRTVPEVLKTPGLFESGKVSGDHGRSRWRLTLATTDPTRPSPAPPQLELETLMFGFYYEQATVRQSLAARQLQREGWAFHTKYNSWFRRLSPPATSPSSETGAYAYFDFHINDLNGAPKGWVPRVKEGFTFDYQHLFLQ